MFMASSPFLFCRNLTQKQRQLIEEFSKEEQSDYDRNAAAGASGWATIMGIN